jgi:L-lactate dehydrogenase (cytochrome)
LKICGCWRGGACRVVFDYIDGGAEGEVTLRENCAAFEAVHFRLRNGVAIPNTDLRTTVLGTQLFLSFWRRWIAVRSIRRRLPRRAGRRYGHVAFYQPFPATNLRTFAPPLSGAWYQLYPCGGREAAEAAIERARAAGFTALVVTIDTGVAGMRERDVRNGAPQLMSGHPGAMLPFLGQMMARPRWLASFLLDGGVSSLPNVVIPGQGPMPLIDVPTSPSRAVVTRKTSAGCGTGGRADRLHGYTADDARRADGRGRGGRFQSWRR